MIVYLGTFSFPLHYFNVYAVQDRTSFQHLSNTPRLVTVEDIDVNKFPATEFGHYVKGLLRLYAYIPVLPGADDNIL